jgi:hypothetical protein
MSRSWRRAEGQSPFAGSLRDVHQNPLNPPLPKGDSPKRVQEVSCQGSGDAPRSQTPPTRARSLALNRVASSTHVEM